MRKIVLFVSVLLMAGLLHAQDVKLKITHLTGDCYVYTTWKVMDGGGAPYPSNSLYVVTTKGVVMIDTPWDTTQFQPLLDSIEARHHQKPVLCISTHFHADRTAGLDFLKQHGVATWSSAMTKQFCIERNEKQAANTFTKDTTFKIGNHTFSTFYPGEGHTKDNILVWFGKEKVLYGGCFIKSTETDNLGNIADANVKAWPASCQKALQRFKDAVYVIPGHMGWESNQGLQHTLKLAQSQLAN